MIVYRVLFLRFWWCVFVFVVGGASCFGVVIIFLFRIPVSLPPDPDTCVVICTNFVVAVSCFIYHSNMNGEPNSEK